TMPFAEMGLVLSAAQFNNLPKWEPFFRLRLRAWGLETPATGSAAGEPIGTVVAMRSVEELAGIVRTHPASDFFVPERYFAGVEPAAQAAHQMLSTSVHGARMLAECLARDGVECLFGYPGCVTLPFYDVLYDHQIRHVLVRHEENAAFAAEGYARATGKVGVCCATSGPGATNLI